MQTQYKFYGTKRNVTIEASSLKEAKLEVKKCKIGKIIQVDTNRDVLGDLI
jgi:hypothetical protein